MRVPCSRRLLPKAALVALPPLLAAGSLISGCGGSIAVNLNTIAAISTPANTLRVNQTLQLGSRYLAAGLPMTVSGLHGLTDQPPPVSMTQNLAPRLEGPGRQTCF